MVEGGTVLPGPGKLAQEEFDASVSRVQEYEAEEKWNSAAHTGVVIVSFQLPVKVVKTEEGAWAVGSFLRGFLSFFGKLVLCVGWG